MIIQDFLGSPERMLLPRSIEADPLRCRGALEDAALLDVRVSGVWPHAWFLLDCKGALDVREGNTAVLVVQALRSLTWEAEEDTPSRQNRAVEVWQPAVGDSGWRLRALFRRGLTLELLAGSAEFYVGDVPGGDDPPPDLGSATDDDIRAGLADWSSEFTPLSASFVDTRHRE